MKKITAIILLITILSCNKEELTPIDGNITVSIMNYIEYGTTPSGFIFEYYENDNFIKDEFKYVGKPYVIYYSSDKPFKAKVYNNGYDMIVTIYYEGEPIYQIKGNKEIIIDRVLYYDVIEIENILK